MIVSIEQHVDFIADLFLKMQKEGDQSVAASQAAQDEWVDHVNELSTSDGFVFACWSHGITQ